MHACVRDAQCGAPLAERVPRPPCACACVRHGPHAGAPAPTQTAPRTEYDLEGVFPNLELTLTGGVTLKLPPYRYAHVVAKTKGNASVKPRASVCLGVFDGNTAAIFGA